MNKRDTLARIGDTLIQVQRTERLINFVVQHTLPADDLSKLFRQGGRRPPLGRLIGKLRSQVEVADTFKETLEVFLLDRNRLIHEIEFVDGWMLETPAGRIAANNFLDRLNRLERKVNRVFAKVAKAWPRETPSRMG